MWVLIDELPTPILRHAMKDFVVWGNHLNILGCTKVDEAQCEGQFNNIAPTRLGIGMREVATWLYLSVAVGA